MSLVLQDQFMVTAPLPLGDHAFGSAIVDIEGGYLVVSVAAPGPLTPPAWMMSGGIWNDAASWDDAANWED